MSEYVLNADLTRDKSEIISDLTLEGYYADTEIPAEFYGKGGTISVGTGMDNNGRYTSLAYNLGNGFITYDESVELSLMRGIYTIKLPKFCPM